MGQGFGTEAEIVTWHACQSHGCSACDPASCRCGPWEATQAGGSGALDTVLSSGGPHGVLAWPLQVVVSI